MRIHLFITCLAFALIANAAAAAADWPQFLGPTRNAVYTGKAIADELPAAGPKVLWRQKVGEGFASPVVTGSGADAKVILFHRKEDRCVLDCLDASTGKQVWSAGYDTDFFDDMRKGNGPRGTPAIADGKIYAFGPDGVLSCVDLAAGKTIWQVNTAKEHRSPKGFFGRGCSPVVEDGLVFLNIGGPQAGVGAFDAKTGKLMWKAGGDEAGYASPVTAKIGEQKYVFFFTRTGLVACDPKSGELFFEQRWRSKQHASVNAASPLVVGNTIVLSTSYEVGATALAVDGKKFETLWAGEDAIASQYANLVHKDGFLYGFDGRNDFGDTKLRCVDLKTGKVRWTQDGLPAGPIVLAQPEGKGDAKLVILLENGDLLFVKATEKEFASMARGKLLREPVRANFALADGLMFARDEQEVVCVDLRAQ